MIQTRRCSGWNKQQKTPNGQNRQRHKPSSCLGRLILPLCSPCCIYIFYRVLSTSSLSLPRNSHHLRGIAPYL